MRHCSHCHQSLQFENLSGPESDGLENDRKAAGLQGMRLSLLHLSRLRPSSESSWMCVRCTASPRGRFSSGRQELEGVIRACAIGRGGPGPGLR